MRTPLLLTLLLLALPKSGRAETTPPADAAAAEKITGAIDLLNGITPPDECGDLAGEEHTLKDEVKDMKTVANAMTAIHDARERRQPLTAAQRKLIAEADELVEVGTPIAPVWKPICCSGFRAHQTNLSLADPGPGHIGIILDPKNGDLLDGLFVHHEYIDRENTRVAPYRYINPETNADVVMHTAGDAPVTAFIGAPNYQLGGFENDKVTPIHATAGDATAVFNNGTADAKVTMDGLTASQAIELMRGVKDAVVRRPDQFLSAAFNVTKPIVDDRPETLAKNGGKPVTVSDPVAIARLGIAVTKAGGWDKVAWDGASEEIPSRPLLDDPSASVRGRITVAEMTSLVHDAHSVGLETYISAGMNAHSMEPAAWTGVDGVGIGTALHAKETVGGALKTGPLDPTLIRDALRIRDAAEASIRGRGARALAQLDSGFARGELSAAQLQLRTRLTDAMLAGGDGDVSIALGIRALPPAPEEATNP